MQVEIVNCRGLDAKDRNGLSDPYVITYFESDSVKKVQKHKTCVKQKTLDPDFDERFVFDSNNKDKTMFGSFVRVNTSRFLVRWTGCIT